MGPSGGGKTTLLRVIAGLLPATRGTVRRPVLEGGEGGPRAPEHRVGYIPQFLGLVRNRTAVENVLLGALGRLGPWRSLAGRFPPGERAAAWEALRRVGMGERGDERVETLSGGERRRVAIARALLQRPRLLLADEFLAEVDRVTAQGIARLLQDLRRDTGMTVIFVDHDLDAACRIADRVLVLARGRVVDELDAATATASRLGDLFRAGTL